MTSVCFVWLCNLSGCSYGTTVADEDLNLFRFKTFVEDAVKPKTVVWQYFHRLKMQPIILNGFITKHKLVGLEERQDWNGANYVDSRSSFKWTIINNFCVCKTGFENQRSWIKSRLFCTIACSPYWNVPKQCIWLEKYQSKTVWIVEYWMIKSKYLKNLKQY